MNVIQIWLFDLRHWSLLHLPSLSHHRFHTLIILVTLWDVKKHLRTKFRKQITMQKKNHRKKSTLRYKSVWTSFSSIHGFGFSFWLTCCCCFFFVLRMQSKHNSNLVYYHMLYPFDNKCWRASGAKYFHYIMMYCCVAAKQRKLSAFLFSHAIY